MSTSCPPGIMRRILLTAALLLGAIAAPRLASAQLLETKTISLEAAKQMVAAAEAEAQRNQWNVAIAIVDVSGDLILFHRLDGTQTASLDIALQKARTAARFKRPTKVLQDVVAGGATWLMAVDGLLPLEGGLPVSAEGQVIGGIGVSGVTAQQDAQVAQAGLSALRP